MIALALALVLAADGGVREVAPLSVNARALPEQVRLGEPFIYELVVTHPKAQRFELHAPGELGAFELNGQSRSRVDGPQTATTTFQFKMSLFELGKKRVPDLNFDVFDEAGDGRWTAQGPEVEGLSSLPADAEEKGAELFGIKPNEAVPVRTYRLLWLLVGLLAAAGLAYAAYRWWKRPRPVEAAPAKPPEALHVRTFASLDQLRAEDLPGKGRVREFYFRLSEILRGYLGERYGFEALECTSSELLDALRRLRTPGLPHDEFVALVNESDFVKFAKAQASADQCKNAIELGYRLVSLTLPQPAPAAPGTHAVGR